MVAAEAGVDYLGFNFVEGVRRQLQPDEGSRIIEEYKAAKSGSANPKLVGLFRNQDPDWVNAVSKQAGFDLLQLCGDEDDAYISQIELPIFKQLFIKEGTTSADLSGVVSPFLENKHGIILDSFNKKALGGSGKSFDWVTAEGVANRENVMLAGGLNPENVQAAIAQLSPWGVDVASGVEIEGVKDPDRIREFIKAVRSAWPG